MANIFDRVKDLEDHKLKLDAPKGTARLLMGRKSEVPICIPQFSKDHEIHLMAFMCNMLAVVVNTGVTMGLRGAALMSALLACSANPSVMLSTYAQDKDYAYIQYFVTETVNKYPFLVITNRGTHLETIMKWYATMISNVDYTKMFANLGHGAKDMQEFVMHASKIGFNMFMNTVLVQFWVCLSKAVTNPDMGSASFENRMNKLVMQKRASNKAILSSSTLREINNVLGYQTNVRSFMVNFLVDLQGAGPNTTEAERLILDIGTYISESGLAGFMNTIEYGLKTRYPILASAELRPALEKVESLIQLYKSKGQLGPFMGILNDPDCIKFAPGAYPMLWSFAMGVAVATNKEMAGLVIDRNFLSNKWYKAGQNIVRAEGLQYNKDMLDALQIDDEGVKQMNLVLNGDYANRVDYIKVRGSAGTQEGEDRDEEEENQYDDGASEGESQMTDMPSLSGGNQKRSVSYYDKQRDEMPQASASSRKSRATDILFGRTHDHYNSKQSDEEVKSILDRNRVQSSKEPEQDSSDMGALGNM
ncbi:nucleoprotein [Salmon aquaparamyxovirus]|uniref:Nucleocapsid n=1 Tax=Salmon aquaparamyxovirus TaxID=381543 RepID=A0A3G2KTF1_9MONO|nr:nucleoprotein [Salmon aquaparamyxovirus]